MTDKTTSSAEKIKTTANFFNGIAISFFLAGVLDVIFAKSSNGGLVDINIYRLLALISLSVLTHLLARGTLNLLDNAQKGSNKPS